MLSDQRLDSRDLSSIEPTCRFKPKRIQPKLCLIRVALNVNVRWLLPVAREKEEPIGSCPENGRSHLLRFCQFLEELASAPDGHTSVRLPPARNQTQHLLLIPPMRLAEAINELSFFQHGDGVEHGKRRGKEHVRSDVVDDERRTEFPSESR